MVREKLVTTFLWATIFIAGSMLADYCVTVILLDDVKDYTPLNTFLIATVVTFPATYVLVSGRLNLRAARDELAAARDAALSANLTKTQFLANMSHELRTPLNAILGFSELLALDAFAEKRVEYAHLINNSGKHLLGLVNDLLDLARIEAHKLELLSEAVSLDALIAECAATIAPRADAARLQVRVAVEPGLPCAFGDPRALKQVLLNLLTNAIKFTPQGGTVEIFAASTATGELAIGVQDNGIGIAEADRARVFERFGQADNTIAGDEKGAGLGLPIVKGLVDAQGGRVALESRIGEGTRVTVWLPCAPTDRTPAISTAA